jgi:hypothetical protein
MGRERESKEIEIEHDMSLIINTNSSRKVRIKSRKSWKILGKSLSAPKCTLKTFALMKHQDTSV